MTYYHIQFEIFSKFDKKRFHPAEYDKTEVEILDDFLKPYYSLEELYVDGRIVQKEFVERIKILKSEKPIDTIISCRNDNIPSNVLMILVRDDIFDYPADDAEDVTNTLIKKAKQLV